MGITVSVCMIVKNESSNLERCLKSLVPISDEIIVVDTGSTDNTKEIAGRFTDKVVDFEWTGSFSDARNYAFSLATCDYIYSADADEELDADNIEKFKILKEVMAPEIDIVQMYYCNQLENNTIYNYDKELRPKLYKRKREWSWEETIHEAVRLDPVIYDSEIEIIHRPGAGHAARDLEAFRRLTSDGRKISDRLIDIYAKELFIAGTDEDFVKSLPYFKILSDMEGIGEELVARIFAVCVRGCRVSGDDTGVTKYALRASAGNVMCSETCCEVALYMESKCDEAEAAMWYYNALNETSAYMNIRYDEEIPREALTRLGVVV